MRNCFQRIAAQVLLMLCGINSPIALANEKVLPECTHWTDAYVFAEMMDKARVNGQEGQRLYLHQENPQLCASLEEEHCRGKAYVIAGDTVTIGLVCNAWTHIQFRAKRSISSGWVETSRLDLIPSEKSKLAARKQYLDPRQHDENDLMFRAVQNGDVAQMEKLVKSGYDQNKALDIAVEMNHEKLVQTLIDLGANPNSNNNKCQLMIRAATSSPSILKALVKAGGQVNCSITWQELTPLQAVADVNRASMKNQAFPLWSSLNSNLEPVVMAKALLEAGADLKASNYWGETAVRWTLESNNVDIADFLLSQGADVNNYLDSSTTKPNGKEVMARGSGLGNTILLEAIRWYPLRWDTSMIELLLQHGADVNYRNQEPYEAPKENGAHSFAAGQTALTIAATEGYINVVKLLLDHGADMSIPRQDGKTALELSIENDHVEVSKLLRDKMQNR